MTRPQSHNTPPLHSVNTVRLDTTLHPYLFFTLVLEAQTRRSLLETIAVVCPGLVRFELHCERIQLPFLVEPAKNEEK